MKRRPKSAAKLVVLENGDPIFAEAESIENRIRQRAFELSHRRPDDAHSRYDWIVAESEIVSAPPAEILEKNGKFEVKFALTGANLGDIDVMLTPDQILLKSEARHEHAEEIGTVHLCEFKSTTVFRSLNFPAPVDANTAKVDVDGGTVRVTVAKQKPQTVRLARSAAGARKTRERIS